MLYDAQWERINDNTWRMELPGGWLVKTVELSHNYVPGHDYKASLNCAMCFVPDPDAAWMVKKG